MTIAILHVGQTKTGSTSIQSRLAANRAVLDAQGVIYSQAFGQRKAGLALRRYSLGELSTAERSFVEGLFEREMNKDPRLIVISDENILDWNRTDRLTRLAELFAGRTETVRVLCYLRRPDEHALSSYQQRIRGGGYSKTIEEFARERVASGRYNYAEKLDRLKAVFGRASLEVRVFQRSERDIVEDFSDWIGVNERALRRYPNERNNTTLDATGIEVVRRCTILAEAGVIGATEWKQVRSAMLRNRTNERPRMARSLAWFIYDASLAQSRLAIEGHVDGSAADSFLAPPNGENEDATEISLEAVIEKAQSNLPRRLATMVGDALLAGVNFVGR